MENDFEWEFLGWSKKTPNKAGWFWFVGDPFTYGKTHAEYSNDLHMVKVVKTGSGFAYIADGNFMDSKNGWWKEAVMPEFVEGTKVRI